MKERQENDPPSKDNVKIDLELIGQYFDGDYYASVCAIGEKLEREELLSHYMETGVKENLDPVEWFCAEYYLDTNNDVAGDGSNPFLHFIKFGAQEGRPALPYIDESNIEELRKLPHSEISAVRSRYSMLSLNKAGEGSNINETEFKKFLDNCLKLESEKKDKLKPLVSVIVPNFNHAKFLEERLDSIFNQSIKNIEVVILDDCSSDDSDRVIKKYVENFPEKITYIRNEENSGNVFRQWRLGYEHCAGDYVWICESDDTAETDFLELMIRSFDDMAVMLAFCRVQFIDAESNEIEGLDAYRERAESGVWGSNRSGPAAAWFAGAFSIHNIIPNVGGCLFRRQVIEDSVWESAQKYSVLGDWFLYLNLSRGGKIVYVENATTYFRQHDNNTSVNSFKGIGYYEEHNELAVAIRKKWDVMPATTWRFYQQLNDQFQAIKNKEINNLFEAFSLDRVLSVEKSNEHVLIGFLGFHVGGGEYFPIYLANALVESGVCVSLLALDTTTKNKDMYEMVDSRVAVYCANDVRTLGLEEFIKQTGVTLVNSHHIGVEGLFFLENSIEIEVPFVSTLHGMYEVAGINEYNLTQLVRKIDHWVYTADKNIRHLENRKWCKSERTKFPNATPITRNKFHLSREKLGISEETFVYVLVSRPVKEKGWEDAIHAFVKIKADKKDVALFLVGEGAYQVELESKYGHIDGIYFLGYQNNMHGLLDITDCCLLPTRFGGESYPLILIQALQSGTPCISTTIGEIPALVSHDDTVAAILVDHLATDKEFVDLLANSMMDILDENVYQELEKAASVIGAEFDIGKLALKYIEMYSKLLNAAPINKELKPKLVSVA